ncbi:cyanamide hydratase [Ganoderma leucocontextum]|nr:cyanamide hydratase [Ganoderma leucocontextum]
MLSLPFFPRWPLIGKKKYGFAPVARDPEVLFKDHPTASGPNPKQDPFTVEDFPLPVTPLVQEVRAFAQSWMNRRSINRVFVYGSALVKTHFPEWKFNENATAVETYALSCLLHDIGTAEKFLATTHMSFEFKGAIVARDLILGLGGPEPEADSVCDAIIRHQDIFVKDRANLVHPRLIETTTVEFPRKGWSEHFARVIEKELVLKPWCHTSTFEVPNWKEGVRSNFATDVRGNKAMRPFD